MFRIPMIQRSSWLTIRWLLLACLPLIAIMVVTYQSSAQGDGELSPDNGTMVYLPLVRTTGTYIEPDPIFEMPGISDIPLLMRVTQHDGLIYNYFGSRTETGTPTRLEQVIIQDPDEELNSTVVIEDKRAKEISVSSGEKFEIDYISDTEFTITGTTADRKSQETIHVDLNQLDLLSPSFTSTVQSTAATEQSFSETTIASGLPTGLLSLPAATNIPGALEGTPPNVVKLETNICGELANTSVQMDVKYMQVKDEEDFDIPILVKTTSDGEYEAPIPTEDGSQISDLICKGTIQAMAETSCKVITTNPAVSASICARFVSPNLVAACLVGLATSNAYCTYVPGSPLSDLLVSAVCSDMKHIGFESAQIQITARAWLNDEWVHQVGTYGLFDPIPLYEFSYGKKPALGGEIQVVAAGGDEPKRGEPYQVWVSVEPCDGSHEYTIGVSRSDGVPVSMSFYPKVPGWLTLDVPGTENSTKDVITVVVDGFEMARKEIDYEQYQVLVWDGVDDRHGKIFDITKTPDKEYYAYGEEVTLEAVALMPEKVEFAYWSLFCADERITENPYTFTVEGYTPICFGMDWH